MQSSFHPTISSPSPLSHHSSRSQTAFLNCSQHLMASCSSGMLVYDNPDGEVNLPEAQYVCRGCRCAWDNLRFVTTELPCGCDSVQCTVCEDEESSAMRRSMLSFHFATDSMGFRFPSIFQPGKWESMCCLNLLPIYEVGQLHKFTWNKSY